MQKTAEASVFSECCGVWKAVLLCGHGVLVCRY